MNNNFLCFLPLNDIFPLKYFVMNYYLIINMD